MDNGLQWIDQHSSELVALAQAIREYAEVGLQESKSAAAQVSFLTQQGFRVKHGVAGMPTAIVAEFGQGRPIIGFLGEYDALPGLSQKAVPHREPVREGGMGHGCGHNLLGVGSIGATLGLKHDIESGKVQGTVRYYGCPAEDSASGKVFMAKHGLFNDLDAAITWHPMYLNTARIDGNLANNSVRFAFHGRTAHAAASPHMGISALDAVELMNVGVNYLREHIIQDARIHYVITHGGGQPNVVPDYAEVWYYVRAPHRYDPDEIYQRIIKIAQGACLMTGATLEIKFLKGVHEILHNPVLSQVLEDSLQRVGAPPFDDDDRAFARELEQSFDPGQKLSVMRSSDIPCEYWDITLHEGIAPMYGKDHIAHGSTDVAEVSWIAPTGEITTAAWVAGASGHSWQATATCGMGIGHKAMLTAAKAMCLAGHELMTRPDLLQKAQEAFLLDTGGKPYVSPLPAEMMEPPFTFEGQ